MELQTVLAYLYPDARPEVDYRLQDDGDGPYIAAWGLPEPEPGEAELSAAEPTAIRARQWADYKSMALTEIATTDVTVNRIAEAVALGHTTWGAPDVVAFMEHRRDLRAILSQPQPDIIPDQLPAHPGYPAGT
jgi:hypothetical protein